MRTLGLERVLSSSGDGAWRRRVSGPRNLCGCGKEPTGPYCNAMSNIKNLEQELQRMADEVRVKIHLAGMDAKDAWEKLEPKLKEFEHKLGEASDRVEAELVDAAHHLKTQLDKLRERLAAQ